MSTKPATSGQTGQNIYAVVFSDDSVWNGSAFAAYLLANYSSYPITATEILPGYYTFTFPSTAAAGIYKIMFFRRDGGSPAAGDTVWDGPRDYEWDGSAQVTVASRLATGTVSSDVTAIKAKTDNLPGGVQKNTALNNFEFLMVDSTDHASPKTGLTVTAQRSIDGAAFASCANSASEVGNGVYKINLAAGDLNGTVITFKFTASGADARYLTAKTAL